MERCICSAPIIGYNPSTRSCSTHRPDTTRPGKGKESDPAVAWPVLQHTLGRPKSGSHQLLAPAFVIGTRIPCRYGFRYRAENPSWMDQEEAPADILKQWQEARANRRMQFKVGNYRDGDWVSNIRMLTGTIKADWIQLPVERYLAALPTLRHGVIAGVFRNKGAAPWGITRAEKLQLSVFLPNDLSLDDWYAGVYALPTVWPEASMLGDDYLRKVVGYDFHLLRKKYDVQSMWGDLAPQWRLLKSQLETKGPGWYSPAEREERLFTNKSNRPGDDMKEALRTDGHIAVWQAWTTTQNQLRQLRQPAPPLVFPGEAEIFRDMYTQVGEEEQIIPPPGGCKEEGAKKEEAGWWQCPDGVAAMLLSGKARPLVAWCHIWVFFTPGGEKSLDTLLDGLFTCRGWQFLSAYQYDWNAWIGAGTYWKFLNINVFALPQRWRQLHYCLSLRVSMYLAIMEVWHFLHAAEEVVRAGVYSILHQVVRAWARFTCFTFHWLVNSGGSFCFLFGCCLGWVCCFFIWLTNHCDRVIYRWLV